MGASKIDNEYKYKLTESGDLFELNTAQELGDLMASRIKRIENRYDPQSTDYDDFHRAVWDYRDSTSKDTGRCMQFK